MATSEYDDYCKSKVYYETALETLFFTVNYLFNKSEMDLNSELSHKFIKNDLDKIFKSKKDMETAFDAWISSGH